LSALVSIALALDDKGALAGEPAVESIGIPELDSGWPPVR